MAISLYFSLSLSAPQAAKKNIPDTHPLTIRCHIRYTLSPLAWGADRALGRAPIIYAFSTTDKCPAKHWSGGRCKPHWDGSASINRRLEQMRERAKYLHESYCQTGKFPPPAKFAIEVLGGMGDDTAGANTFWGRFSQYIDCLTAKGCHKTYIERACLTMRMLKKYEKSTKQILDFAELGAGFAAQFTRWVQQQPQMKRRVEQDMAKTAAGYLSALKKFVNYAHKEEWTDTLVHKRIQIRVRRKDEFPVTLTEEEVAALDSLDLSGTGPKMANLRNTRDWMVFATQTGMRYQSWGMNCFKIIDVPGGKNIQMVQEKTINPVEIPLSNLAIRVLARNGWVLPEKMTPASICRHLGYLCTKCGIARTVTTHTARRTFCTLQEKAGVPRAVIMRISGHKTEHEYLKYLGISFAYNAQMLRDARPDIFDVKSA